MTLTSFKRNPTCPKCGHDGIHFQYVDAKERPTSTESRETSQCGWVSDVHWDEHIHLECARCSYGKQHPWIMAIADDPNRIVGFRMPSGSTGVVTE